MGGTLPDGTDGGEGAACPPPRTSANINVAHNVYYGKYKQHIYQIPSGFRPDAVPIWKYSPDPATAIAYTHFEDKLLPDCASTQRRTER
jgi:hypothetical protein